MNNDNKHWLKDDWFEASILIVVAILGLGIVLAVLPKANNTKVTPAPQSGVVGVISSGKVTGPTERALAASAYIYVGLSPDTEKKKFRDEWGSGSDVASVATENLALFLDKNPDKLALIEATINQDKVNKSRPVVNYQLPTVVQQQTYPNNCTSHTIAGYTYTNCN